MTYDILYVSHDQTFEAPARGQVSGVNRGQREHKGSLRGYPLNCPP